MLAIAVMVSGLATAPIRVDPTEQSAHVITSTSSTPTPKPTPIVIRFLDYPDLRSHQCSVEPSAYYPACDDLAQAFCSEIGYTNAKVLGVGPMGPGDTQNIALYGMVCYSP